MNQLLIDTLEDCLILLEAGISLEDCMSDCYEHREEIRDLLITAQVVRNLSVDELPSGSFENGKNMSLLERVDLKGKIFINPKSI